MWQSTKTSRMVAVRLIAKVDVAETVRAVVVATVPVDALVVVPAKFGDLL